MASAENRSRKKKRAQRKAIEYSRRMRAVTRKQETNAQKQEANAVKYREANARKQEANAVKYRERENLLSGALGIASAVGYSANVLPKAIGLSKGTRTNYLTNTLRKIKLKEAFLKGYNKTLHTSPLHYAVKTHNPFAVQFFLENERGLNRNQTNVEGFSPLDLAFYELQNKLAVRVRNDPYGGRAFSELLKESRGVESNLLRIITILMKAGSTITPKTLGLLWRTCPHTNALLEQYPHLKQLTYEHRHEILQSLNEAIAGLQEDMSAWIQSQMEFGENIVEIHADDIPPHFRDEEEHLDYCMNELQLFLMKYNPDTGNWYPNENGNEYRNE